MRIRRFRPRVVLLVAVVAYLALTTSLEAAQKPTKPGGTIAPPKRVAEIKFLKETGFDLWNVRLTRGGSVNEVQVRLSGASCSDMGEIHPGMTKALYEDMTFKTKSGKTCMVQAIQR